jgi:hypothetical protein
MARQTFFSFRYKNDNWRASIVRNSWVTKIQASGFFDSAEWEEVRRKNDASIESWIDEQMKGTSVTVVLIGSDTADKKWINYEILSSHRRGNGLLGIHIHGIKNSLGQTATKGKNPFDSFVFKRNGLTTTYPVYDWIAQDGFNNMGTWIETAAREAGR